MAGRTTASATLIGQSNSIRAVRDWVASVAGAEAPVIIFGESGTGKELVARALHLDGTRRAGPFVAVNCSAFPEALIEAELFGHVKGAFTGAVSRREGRFRMADHGTLFLDEVAELSPAAQAKLLRVLQDGTIEPLGMDGTLRVDVRIVSATHVNLLERVADGRFRADLYYRLNVFQVALPPLRDRAEDLPLLVAHILRRYAPALHEPIVSQGAVDAMGGYPFPGNVRELENVIQYALVMARGHDIGLADLPSYVTDDRLAPPNAPGALPRERKPPRPPPHPPQADQPLSLADARRVFERAYIVEVLRHNQGRRGETAKELEVSRKGLWEKMRGYKIAPAEFGVVTKA